MSDSAAYCRSVSPTTTSTAAAAVTADVQTGDDVIQPLVGGDVILFAVCDADDGDASKPVLCDDFIIKLEVCGDVAKLTLLNDVVKYVGSDDVVKPAVCDAVINPLVRDEVIKHSARCDPITVMPGTCLWFKFCEYFFRSVKHYFV